MFESSGVPWMPICAPTPDTWPGSLAPCCSHPPCPAALSVAVEHPALAQEPTPMYVVTYFEVAPRCPRKPARFSRPS